MNSKSILLSTAYLPPVQYISKFLMYDKIWIEAYENFSKQTYRNRCVILSANGKETLTLPIVKGNSKQQIKDVQIAYDTPWQHIHWNAIVSAYNSTPFFEILADDFKLFFQRRYKYLLDFNMEIIQCILNILELDRKIQLTKGFEEFEPSGINFRESIHPKIQKAREDTNFKAMPYSQVFDHKFSFQQNISIIDLLFNCGSASYEVILRSIQK